MPDTLCLLSLTHQGHEGTKKESFVVSSVQGNGKEVSPSNTSNAHQQSSTNNLCRNRPQDLKAPRLQTEAADTRLSWVKELWGWAASGLELLCEKGWWWWEETRSNLISQQKPPPGAPEQKSATGYPSKRVFRHHCHIKEPFLLLY